MLLKITILKIMGEIRKISPVMLVIGVLAESAEAFYKVREKLSLIYGQEETILEPFDFTFTNYYVNEIGQNPVRAFIAYETLIKRDEIPSIKLHTNEMELEIAEENGTPGLRPVNLDPGYMTLGQFFLATTKDQRQRVYVRDGIFVEPTLYFEAGHFHAFDWTYRDYQSEKYISFLENVRSRLAFQLSTKVPYRLRATLQKNSKK